MRDYAELVQSVHCCAENQCEICPRGDTPVGCIECKTKLADDTTDAIEALQAQIPKWISVEERLPEIERSVLLFNGAVHIGWRVDGKRYRFLSDKYPDHLTHWMPLPSTEGLK